MTETRWKRLAGFCLLAALALHDGNALAQDAGQGSLDYWVLGQLPLVPPDLPAGEPPLLVVAGYVCEDPSPTAASALSAPPPSRGPPS